MGKVDKRIQECLENPLLLPVDAGLEIGEKLRAPIRGESKKQAKQARKKVEKAIRPVVKKFGKDILEAGMSLAESRGGALYAAQGGALYGTHGGALYASRGHKIKGGGERVVDQKASLVDSVNFLKKELPDAIKGKASKSKKRLVNQEASLKDAGNFFTKELPKAFGGGALQRNTQHSTASDLYVMGDLLSDFEIHPAMRSQPLHQNFALTRTLPPQFQKYHKTVI